MKLYSEITYIVSGGALNSTHSLHEAYKNVCKIVGPPCIICAYYWPILLAYRFSLCMKYDITIYTHKISYEC